MGKLVLSLAIALVSSACGGIAQRSSDGVDAGGGPAGGSPAGGMAAGGAVGSAGSGATGGGGFVPPGIAFDDAFPWLDSSGYISLPTSPVNRVLHLLVSGSPAQETLSTHNLFDALPGATSLRFVARATETTRLRVSVGRVQPSYDYFASREAGQFWPEADAVVDPEWREMDVRLADMRPPEPAEHAGQQSFYIAFIVEHPVPLSVWIDDVRLE